MIDLERFRVRRKSFERLDSKHFPYTFDEFWKWKLKIETKNEHILDDNHRDETHCKLSKILRIWQAYLPYDSSPCLKTLEKSLSYLST